MVIQIVIMPSNRKDKKFMARIDDKKTIHFGAKGMSDYTIHKDDERKERYILRHQKNENWNDINTAGFFSRWILWEKPTLSEAVKNINNKFKNINVKFIATGNERASPSTKGGKLK